MTRQDAVARVASALPPGALVVACNGMIGRELYTAADSPRRFYMIGSMGLASSIGLGLALARPSRTIVVFDGDGNVLMNLGTLGNVAAARPANFYHVVFDNGVHGSTGGQRTIAGAVPIDRVAEAAGYARAARTDRAEALDAAAAELFGAGGPAMLLVKVDPGNAAGVGRVAIEPPAMARRFRAAALEEPR